MRSVARRYRALYEEIAGLDAQLERLVADAAPGMLALLLGVGADHAATLLVAAGDNPERLKSEASLASRTRAGSAIGPKKREGDASRYRTNHPDRQLWRYGLEEKPRGFRVLPRRWVVERTFAWLGHARRLAKDYERLPETAEAMIHWAMSQIMLRRLANVVL